MQALQVDEDHLAPGGRRPEFRGEADAAVAGRTGLCGVDAPGCEQGEDVAEAVQVADVHPPVPLRLPDRQQDAVVLAHRAAYDDVDLVGRARGGGGDRARGDLDGQAAEGLGVGVLGHPFTAQVLEVRADDLAQEGVPGLRPDRPRRVAPAGEASLVGADHRVVERDQGLGDAVRAAVVAERVRLHGEQSAALEHGQRPGDVGGLASHRARDAPAGVVAGRHRREHGVVERAVAYVGFGVQQELGRVPVAQRVHDQVEPRPAVQGG
ncbi:hypothetical protein [Streptomyces sp. NPDC003832]